MMKREASGVVFVLAAAACFGAIPAIVKTAYAGGAGIFELLSVRYLLASCVLVPIVFLRSRTGLPPRRKLVAIMAVSGIFLSLEAVLYFYSITLLPTSFAALVLFTFPLIVNVFALFGGNRMTGGGWAAMGVCLAGLAAVLGPDLRCLSIIGILCAFFAAVSYSIYLALIDRQTDGVNPAVTNAVVSVSNAVTMTAAALATGSLHLSFGPSAWVAIAVLVVVSNLAGYQFFFRGLNLLGSSKASVLNMAEPLVTVIIAVAFLGEKLSAVQAAGAISLLAGLFAFVYITNRGMRNTKIKEIGAA